MGRELMRVALDFEWPLNEKWSGYLNPHTAKSHECDACGGSGQTTARQRLGDLVSLLMLSGNDAREGTCHPFLAQASLCNTQGMTPSRDMAELTVGLAGNEPSLVGHNSSDSWNAQRKIIAAAGLSEAWGLCTTCKGEGTLWESEKAKQAAEAWEQKEPPAGSGYQIWETSDEGCPISPVFASAAELATYMAGRPWGADKGSSYESWMRFINGPGWSLSMVSNGQSCKAGAEAAF
jgi:hypothetical protein